MNYNILKTKTTMKKTYINPSIDVIEFKATHQMLAGSNFDTSNETPKEWGARRFVFDDDEEEY